MTTQITLTELEKQVLLGINNSDYCDCLGDQIWSSSIECKVKGKTLSGVCGSLSQKGLVESYDEGKDSTIWLTELGKEVCREYNLVGKAYDEK